MKFNHGCFGFSEESLKVEIFFSFVGCFTFQMNLSKLKKNSALLVVCTEGFDFLIVT